MYLEEQIVNGVLCHRITTDGQWIPYSGQELTNKYLQALESHKESLQKWYDENEVRAQKDAKEIETLTQLGIALKNAGFPI